MVGWYIWQLFADGPEYNFILNGAELFLVKRAVLEILIFLWLRNPINLRPQKTSEAAVILKFQTRLFC